MTIKENAFLQYISRLNIDEDIPAWSGYMPDKHLAETQLFFDLPTVVRALMIADGTVTMALEVIYKEPIEVVLLDQHNLVLANDVNLLGVKSGEEAFYREVQLIGKHSKKQYVRAYSLLKKDALSDKLWTKLRNQEVGMGVVLRNAAQGSFRKVLHMGLGDINLSGSEASVNSSADNQHVHRTYSVNIEEKPAILITEVFSMPSLVAGLTDPAI